MPVFESAFNVGSINNQCLTVDQFQRILVVENGNFGHDRATKSKAHVSFVAQGQNAKLVENERLQVADELLFCDFAGKSSQLQ